MKWMLSVVLLSVVSLLAALYALVTLPGQLSSAQQTVPSSSNYAVPTIPVTGEDNETTRDATDQPAPPSEEGLETGAAQNQGTMLTPLPDPIPAERGTEQLPEGTPPPRKSRDDSSSWRLLLVNWIEPILLSLLAALGAFLGGLASRYTGQRLESAVATNQVPARKSVGNNDDTKIILHLRQHFDGEVDNAEAAIAYINGLRHELHAIRSTESKLPNSKKPESTKVDGIDYLFRLMTSAYHSARENLSGDPEFAEFESLFGFEKYKQGLETMRKAIHSGHRLAELKDDVWIQTIFRGEAACHAYCPNSEGWNQLRLALAAASIAVRSAFRNAGVHFDFIRLLHPLGDGVLDKGRDEQMSIANLTSASLRLRDMLPGDTSPVAIDCLRVGYYTENELVRSRVMIFNPSDWN